jgi:hypothetical protein
MSVNIGPNNTYENNLTYNVDDPISVYNPFSGLVMADPRFVRWKADGSGNYRLSKTSPALDTGVTHGAPLYDITLAPRPAGTAIDRGAHEGAF